MSSPLLRLAPLAAALAACLVQPSFASEFSLEAGAEASAEADIRTRRTTELGTVEVKGEAEEEYNASRSNTATRTDTALRDIPQSITIVTQALIRDQAMQGTADALRYVPGVGMAQGEGNRDTPIFRGSASTADLFIDGMRDDVQYFRDLYNIERVEVHKGPNAMIFGRGSSGGLMNRVSKQADWQTVRRLNLQLGSWDKRRLALDLGQAINADAAFRVMAVAEDTGSFRDGVEASRRGINPTISWRAGEDTEVRIGAEHFEEERTADRGISSFQGRPLEVDRGTFFGDPERSTATIDVDALNLVVEHQFENGASLTNRTRYATYDKFYQNVYPGASFANGTVAIQAYNDATRRDNLLNQTDLVWAFGSGFVRHTLLAGVEFGRQETDSFRNTGFFPASACPASGAASTTTATCVPIADPRYTGPITFRQNTNDADRSSVARAAALYLQDQIEFGQEWQAIIGVRRDRFQTEQTNQRTGEEFSSNDDLLSPRVGVIYRPDPSLSFYASYSIAFQPRSGEQLGSLAANNASLDPEKFKNLELGAKWDLTPGLALTAAVYRLDRGNVAVASPTPTEPTRLILVDGQRVEGLEIGVSGRVTDRWTIVGGLAWQDAQLTRGSDSVVPQVPRRSFSLWNRYEATDNLGFGLGIVSRSAVFASVSNAVALPGYTRLDAAAFHRFNDRLRLQLNVENLLDKDYFVSAHNDTNISPGTPRAFSLGLNLDF